MKQPLYSSNLIWQPKSSSSILHDNLEHTDLLLLYCTQICSKNACTAGCLQKMTILKANFITTNVSKILIFINCSSRCKREIFLNWLLSAFRFCNLNFPALFLQFFRINKVKGQLILKANCQAVDSPKKRANKFAFFDLKSCYVVKPNAFCSFFW